MLNAEDIAGLRRLMEAREAADEADKEAKRLKKEFRDAEADLFEKLTDPETGNVRRIPPVDLGEPWGRVAFQARETPYGRVIDEAAALTYFKEHGMLDEHTERKPKKKRLNELARELIEGAHEFPPGLDFYYNRGVTVTRQKG